MSEKLATGVGVPFTDPIVSNPSSSIADGYYYQLDVTESRTATGWTAGSLLHDGSTATGHATAAGGTARYISLLVAKATGMTFDNFLISPGYSNTMAYPVFYGSDDLSSWTALTMGASPAPFGHVSFSYEANMPFSFVSPFTYKYIAFTLGDNAPSGAQAGCADIRVKLASSEVGP